LQSLSSVAITPTETTETVAAVLGVFGAGALLIFVVLLLIPREMGFRQCPRDLSGALGSADPAAADG